MKWSKPAVLGGVLVLGIVAWALGLHMGLWPIPGTMPNAAPPATPSISIDMGKSATVTPTVASMGSPSAVAQTASSPTAKVTRASTDPTHTAPTPEPSHTLVVQASAQVTDVMTPEPTATNIAITTPPYTADQRLLVVDQDNQVMHVYENREGIRDIPVSTGAPVVDAFTPAWKGRVGPFWGKAAFRNTDLWADFIWYLFPGSEGSILIHSVPYTRSGDVKIYDDLEALGVRPASRGCVRISPEDAEWLATWNPVGVPIEITPWTGDISPAEDPS